MNIRENQRSVVAFHVGYIPVDLQHALTWIARFRADCKVPENQWPWHRYTKVFAFSLKL